LLNLRNNGLVGPAAPALRCHKLISLDVSANLLTGALPATPVRTSSAGAEQPERRAGRAACWPQVE
jgi:hypothetical protein